jgi:hypothetical protein
MNKTFKVDYIATLDLSVDIKAKSAADAVKKFWKLDDKLAPETLDFFDTSVEGKFEIKEVRMDGTVPSPIELAKDAPCSHCEQVHPPLQECEVPPDSYTGYAKV